MKPIIDTYDNNSHRTLGNKTPNQVLKDNDDQIARHINDSVHNKKVGKTVPFDYQRKNKNLIKENKNLVKSYIQSIKGKDINYIKKRKIEN